MCRRPRLTDHHHHHHYITIDHHHHHQHYRQRSPSTITITVTISPSDVPERRAIDPPAPVLQAHGRVELAQRHPARAALRRGAWAGGTKRRGRERERSISATYTCHPLLTYLYCTAYGPAAATLLLKARGPGERVRLRFFFFFCMVPGERVGVGIYRNISTQIVHVHARCARSSLHSFLSPFVTPKTLCFLLETLVFVGSLDMPPPSVDKGRTCGLVLFCTSTLYNVWLDVTPLNS